MPRIEDKIRILCAELLMTTGDDLRALVELRDALHEHVEHLRERLASYPILVERRVRHRGPRAVVWRLERSINYQDQSTNGTDSGRFSAQPPEKNPSLTSNAG